MTLITHTTEYKHGQALLEAYVAGKDVSAKPTIVIAHMWAGRVEFVCEKARAFAELGYTAVAIDMYGKGVIGKDQTECAALMQPFIDDRRLLQQRILAGYEAAKELPEVDSKNIIAIGYCFGGMCVLDLARSGADIKAVVSIHGLFDIPDQSICNPIKAKIFLMHGSRDPMADMNSLITIQQELDDANADWQCHLYGNTMHAFTNPIANDIEAGTVYSKQADQLCWQSLTSFIQNEFAE